MRLFIGIVLSPLLTASVPAPEQGTPVGGEDHSEAFDVFVHTGWESRYLTEGRDNLDGDSLWTSSLELNWQNITGGAWFGRSPDQDYDELQLNLALTEHIGDFSLYAGYTYLRTPFDGFTDNEIGAGVAWVSLPAELEVSLDGYYSFEAAGSFWELSLNRHWQANRNLVLSFSSVFGINLGYIPDGHEGANHLAVRLGGEYTLSDSLAITFHGVQSWALQRELGRTGDALLVDVSQFALGLRFSF